MLFHFIIFFDGVLNLVLPLKRFDTHINFFIILSLRQPYKMYILLII